MSDWKRNIISVGRLLEARFDRLRLDFKLRFGLLSPLEILPYRGHGTARELFLKGRVLESSGITRSSADDTVWENLRNMARRFASDEIPHARVRARFVPGDGQDAVEVEAVADGEGFFDLRFELGAPLDGPTGWYPVEMELLWPRISAEDNVRATGHVFVPREARFAVVSDVDDTIVQSGVTELLTMLRIALLNNAHTRLPFEGVAGFYTDLQRGGDADPADPSGDGPQNPIFYVSSSPWNLYDLLEDFLDVHDLPTGPLFLKDWSPTSVASHEEHKLGVIRTLLATYPGLPFVLIGDSGEEDPEIYHSVVQEHPGRIDIIYIRDVTEGARDAAVHAIADKMRALGTEMLLVPDTAAAEEHARKNGLVPALPAKPRGPA